MTQQNPLHHLNGLISELKRTAEAIERDSADFPTVNRNIRRVQASIKMLELNVSDIAEG